jgi:hypothetical protein
MDLHTLVVAGGVVLSAALLGVLASFWPMERRRPVLCFKAAVDESCTPRCLRTCDLKHAA